MSGNVLSDPHRDTRSPADPTTSSSGLITRERLLRRLAADTGRVVVLSAPSGFGKSVLLRQWQELDPRPTVEVLLGPQHNDPAALIESIVQGMSRLEVFPDDVEEALHSPLPDFDRVVIPRLISALADRTLPFILVLDELERIESPQALNVIAALCRNMPPGAQLAIASHGNVPIGLGRLRASRSLTELGQKDLTMSRRECAELLEAIDVWLDPPQLEALVERTEGWPAAIYLAGLAVKRSSDPARSVEEFAGDDRIVVDYLREEFLLPASQDQAAFLRGISVLAHLNGQLCDATLGRQNSSSALADLSRSNMLLVPLDGQRGWYRLHPLLREMLQTELHRTEPGSVPGLHRRASEWWATAGDADQAVRHAIEADEPELAGRLLFEAVPEYMTRGKTATIEGWLDLLGPSDIHRSPGACLTAAWASITAGDGPQAERWAASARRSLSSRPQKPEDATLEIGLALADAALSRTGLTAMRRTVAEVAPLLPENDPWRSLCALLDGAGLHLAGDTDSARLRLKEGARIGSVGAPDIQVLCLAQLALLEAQAQNWLAADDTTALARAQIERTGIGSCPTMVLAFAVSALTSSHLGSVSRAREELAAALLLLAELDHFAPWYEVETKLTLSEVSSKMGLMGQARRLLSSAETQLTDIPEESFLELWAAELRDAIQGHEPVDVGLTEAEWNVLRFLPDYLSLPQIAGELCVSTNTVKTHVRAIYRKLEANSRHQAVQRARHLGLLDSA